MEQNFKKGQTKQNREKKFFFGTKMCDSKSTIMCVWGQMVSIGSSIDL